MRYLVYTLSFATLRVDRETNSSYYGLGGNTLFFIYLFKLSGLTVARSTLGHGSMDSALNFMLESTIHSAAMVVCFKEKAVKTIYREDNDLPDELLPIGKKDE